MEKKRKAEEKRQRRKDRKISETRTNTLEEIDEGGQEVSEEASQDQDIVE